MTRAQQFFYDNAGYSYNPSKESPKQGHYNSARRMAKAERIARVNGITFTWHYDPSGCSGCSCDSKDCACSTGAAHETLYCLALNADGLIVGSLHGICGATREYRRVIEAELASEC